MIDIIKKAIQSRSILRIYYNKSKYHKKEGIRIVEPISLGIFSPKNKRFEGKSVGKVCLRGWVMDKSASTGEKSVSSTPNGKRNDPLTKIPGYRMFLIERIKNIEILDEKFRVERRYLAKNRPKHNVLNGYKDKDMNTILAVVTLTEKGRIELDFIFTVVKRNILQRASKILTKQQMDIVKSSNFDSYMKASFKNEKEKEDFENTTNAETKSAFVYGWFINLTKSKKLKDKTFRNLIIKSSVKEFIPK